MDVVHPQSFFPELSDDRLRVIAEALLDIRFTSLRELNSPYDDNYTRESTVFGRQKNKLIDLARNGGHPWLSLRHAGMDLTFTIGAVPCRFFTDDPRNPEKGGFFRRNAVDDLFGLSDRDPVMWRFVVEKGLAEDDEDRVFFIGFNVYQEPVAEWTYGATPSSLYAADSSVPPTVPIGPAEIDVLDDDSAAGNEDVRTANDG